MRIFTYKPLKLLIMKKSFYFFLLGAITVGLFAFVSINKPIHSDFGDSFTETLKNAKAYTLEVAENMPAEDYTFAPHDSVRTFGEQMAHIAMSTKLLNTMFIKGEQVDFNPAEGAKMEKAIGASKEECIKLLSVNFDEIIATIEGMDTYDLEETFIFSFAPNKPELTKEQGFLFIRDHITHHRGQAITTLRIKGHKAPSYRPF